MPELALVGAALFGCGAVGLWLACRETFSRHIESYLAASVSALILTCLLMGGIGLMVVQLF